MSFSIEHVAIRCRDIESSIDYFTRMFDAAFVQAPGRLNESEARYTEGKMLNVANFFPATVKIRSSMLAGAVSWKIMSVPSWKGLGVVNSSSA